MSARTVLVPLLCTAVTAASCKVGTLPTKPDGAVVLEVSGAVEHGSFHLGKNDLDRLPQRSVLGTDPGSGRRATYSGADLYAVFERADASARVDTLVVRTRGGEAVLIPVGVLRHLRPVYATQVDGAKLATPVVAWPTEEQPGLERDPRLTRWWAKDPVVLELAIWSGRLGRDLAPPAGAPEAAHPGSGLFVQRCFACHAIRGVGGTVGPSLTSWASGHGEESLELLLAHHPGRTTDDLDVDLVPPLYAYLQSVASGGALYEESGEPGGAERSGAPRQQ